MTCKTKKTQQQSVLIFVFFHPFPSFPFLDLLPSVDPFFFWVQRRRCGFSSGWLKIGEVAGGWRRTKLRSVAADLWKALLGLLLWSLLLSEAGRMADLMTGAAGAAVCGGGAADDACFGRWWGKRRCCWPVGWRSVAAAAVRGEAPSCPACGWELAVRERVSGWPIGWGRKK